MAIGQAIYSTRIAGPQTSFFYPFETSDNTSQHLEENHFAIGGGQARKRPRGNNMVKPNRSMSTGVSKRKGTTSNNAKSSSSSIQSTSIPTTCNRPLDPTRTTPRRAEHRRQSSQSLTLDLEGLDLGQGIVGTLEQTREESSTLGNKRVENRSRSRFRSTSDSKSQGDSPREAAAATTLTNPTSSTTTERVIGGPIEDSFFAHLRNCEVSHDILDTAHALSLCDSNPSVEKDLQSAQQVLGGFASLGYASNAPSQINLHHPDLDYEGSNTSSVPGSPFLNHRKTATCSWSTLVPLLHDPMSTLDILSIEEMGLHSIDVGSSEVWEGFRLAYHCEDCQDDEEEEAKQAQWTIARSSKRQRKWIVTPESSSSESRTIVVSNHVNASARPDSNKMDQSLSASSRLEASSVFTGQSKFDLRFLQAGTTAPNLTVLLANHATHKLIISRNGIDEYQQEINLDGSAPLSSAKEGLATVSVHHDLQSTNRTDKSTEGWPSMRSMATTRLDVNPPLNHAKSSSTIHAPASPIIQLESRRPSLGRSVSHESLAFHSIQQESSPRQFGHSPLRPYPSQSTVQTAPVNDFAFSNYSLDLRDSKKEIFKAISVEESPKASTQIKRQQQQSNNSNSQQQDLRPRTPILSLIDSERMAEYHRLSNQSSGFTRTTTLRKDRRLSEWFKKKVMPTSPIIPPPLPAAWEQTMDQYAIANPALIAPASTIRNSTKPNKIVKTSRPGNSPKSSSNSTAEVSPFHIKSSFNISTSSLSSNARSSEEGEYRRPINMSMPTPLSQIQTIKGQNVWPGVFSQRYERRRSNSDDNIAALGEAARRRLEVLGEDAMTPTQENSTRTDYMDLVTACQDDSLNQFSLSMPDQSILSAYGEFALRDLRGKAAPFELLNIDSVPSQALTMIIPLPINNYQRSDQRAARYLRISYVPFGKNLSNHGGEDLDREYYETDPSALIPHSTVSSNWYKKLTHAWSSGPRSGSPGSNEEEQETLSIDIHSANLANNKNNHNEVESFRIIAKVLENPNVDVINKDDNLLPSPTPFPVILGLCDQQRILKLIPEGWQAISLPDGPAEIGSPLGGVADLIMAGCAACMEL